MHSTSKFYIDQVTQGTAPASWGQGDEFFKKAKFIAATAWDAVRGDDPPLAECDLSFQETCIGITESIMSGNEPDNTVFAHKVRELVKQLPQEAIQK